MMVEDYPQFVTSRISLQSSDDKMTRTSFCFHVFKRWEREDGFDNACGSRPGDACLEDKQVLNTLKVIYYECA